MKHNNLGESIDLTKDATKIAIIDETIKLSYQQLHDQSNAVAVWVRAQGVTAGDRVALDLENGIDLIVAQLGVLKTGAVAVLINNRLPRVQKDYIINSSNSVKTITDLNWLESEVCEFTVESCDQSHPALIIYTSGSTANPKGVIVPHGYKQNILNKIKQGLSRTTLTANPLAQAAGLFQLYYSLLTHSTLVIQKKFDSKKFIHCIDTYGIDNIAAVPTVLSLVLAEKDLINQINLSKVVHVGLSSAPVSKKLYQAIKEKFTQAHITNNYGSSEAGPGLFNHATEIPVPELSVGYPYPHISYRLNQGVLEIKNLHMMLGYNNTTTSNITSDGYFITNDIFEVDEKGFYYYVGRADDMFTYGGNNIYPRQVELSLESHPAVISAAVLGIADEIKGHVPYAFVVLSSNISEDELKTFVLTVLPPSHCPKNIWSIDSLPINLATNKINKQELIEKVKLNLL